DLTAAFQHDVHIQRLPVQLAQLGNMAHTNTVAIHQQMPIIRHLHRAGKAAVGAVVAQHITDGVDVGQLINGHHLQIVAVTMLVQRTQHAAADAAKTIDGNAGGHEQHSGRNKGRILADSGAGREGRRCQAVDSTDWSGRTDGTLLPLWQAVAVFHYQNGLLCLLQPCHYHCWNWLRCPPVPTSATPCWNCAAMPRPPINSASRACGWPSITIWKASPAAPPAS